MTTPRISASNYSNSAPLIWSFIYGANHGKFEMILDNAPARSAELLAQNRVDAALVPVIAYQLIENVLLIPDVCVGARERVRSVCLVTKGCDLSDVKSVSLDISSKTSFNLTKIIFAEFLNLEPIYTPAKPNLDEMLKDSDCALLIGDPALIIDETKFRKFDLAETWKKFTGFGFVFAMWMANAEKIENARKINFAAARDEGLSHLDEIISNYESQISLSRKDFKKYLSENISYSIDDSMQNGLELYFKLAHKHKLINNYKPLDFI
jgi:chorismate dehydratase